MDDLTDDYGISLPMGNADPGLPLIVSTSQGDYTIFPRGIREFAEKHNAEAVNIDADGHIWALREGLGNKMDWVLLTIEAGPALKEKKTNG